MSVRVYWIAFSILGVVLSLISLKWPGPTEGTDFKGGTEVEIAFKKPIEAGPLRSAVEHIGGFSAPEIVSVTDPANPNRFLIRVQEVTNLDESKRSAIDNALCYGSLADSAPERCPAEKRPTEVKFSPGGDKIFVRYEKMPDLSAITEEIKT